MPDRQSSRESPLNEKKCSCERPFRSQFVPWLASMLTSLGRGRVRARPQAAMIRRQMPRQGGRYARQSIANSEGTPSFCCADPVRRIRALRLRAIRDAIIGWIEAASRLLPYSVQMACPIAAAERFSVSSNCTMSGGRGSKSWWWC